MEAFYTRIARQFQFNGHQNVFCDESLTNFDFAVSTSDFIQRNAKVLRSLTAGAFYYAPDLPFGEQCLDPTSLPSLPPPLPILPARSPELEK